MTGHIAPPSIRASFHPAEYYIVVHRMAGLDDGEAEVWRPVFQRGRRVPLHLSPAAAALDELKDAAEFYGRDRVAIAKLVPQGIEVVGCQLSVVGDQPGGSTSREASGRSVTFGRREQRPSHGDCEITQGACPEQHNTTDNRQPTTAADHNPAPTTTDSGDKQ